jgi:hypothetical protein
VAQRQQQRSYTPYLQGSSSCRTKWWLSNSIVSFNLTAEQISSDSFLQTPVICWNLCWIPQLSVLARDRNQPWNQQHFLRWILISDFAVYLFI